MKYTTIPKHPIKVRRPGYVYFPIEYIRKYDLMSKEFEWAENAQERTLVLIPTEGGRKMSNGRNIMLPSRVAQKYVGSYHLEQNGEMFILRPTI